jgi:hypothetical protein
MALCLAGGCEPNRSKGANMYSTIPTDTLAAAFELLCYFFSAGAAAIGFLMAQK